MRSCRAVVWDGNDLLTHTTSLTHKAVVTAKANPLKRAFDVIRTTCIIATKTATQCLMATTLTCIKERLPISKFAPLLALEKFLGVDQIAHKYNHSRYFWSALFNYSEVLLQKQVERIKASSNFALLIDSSTNVSTKDHLLIYVKYLHLDTLVATTEYLTYVKLLATTADAITAVLLGVMTALGLDVQRMAGFYSDGATIMAGVKSGVVARLKAVNPCIVAVRCVVHRTALVMSNTAKSSSELQVVDSELRQVHNLFNHNSKRQSQWEAFVKGYNITQFRFPIFNATRWFSWLQCVVVLTNNLAELIIFLGRATRKHNSKQPWPAGATALEELCDVQAATKLNLLRDIMLPLDVLSKKF
ncbi:hypothetical protein BDL97_15G024600 [Sphagnum fallax]|nr:hypothetical protein BDL97_15G024600 [Sphagnum fallax]